MPAEIDETTDDTTTESDSADETATNDSPVDDASSSAEPGAEDDVEEVEETPEAKVEREKKARADARIAAAEAAEKRAETGRKARQRQRDEQEREERIAARERQADETLRRAQSALEEIEQRKQVVFKGGVEGLKALGIEYGDWTKKTLEDTGPEALARQAIERADRVDAELRRRDQEAAQARARAAQEDSVKRFEAFVDTNAEDFPFAAALPSRLFRVLADEAAETYIARHRVPPSYSALLPLLDKAAKDLHDEQQAKSAKRARSSDTASDAAPNTRATTNGQPASTPANRTLSNATAATKASAPRRMTAEEEDEWALAELRQAMKADTARAG